MPNSEGGIQAIALLAEPVRGELYRWVIDAGRAVSRDEAAVAVGVSRSLAAFHLDRLVGAGLMVAEFRRLSGRTGPGAGRPAKLYRRGPREVVVSLPERHYEIAAEVLSETIEQLDEQSLDTLRTTARQAGEQVGSTARRRAGSRPSQKRLRAALLEALAERGYQPREAAGDIRLGNCPFQSLVDDHRTIVCGMNLALADGLISGLGERHTLARLDPQPGHCCVAFGRVGRGSAG